MVDGDTQTVNGCTMTSAGSILMISDDTRMVDGSTLTVGGGTLMDHSQHRLDGVVASRTRQHLHQHGSITSRHGQHRLGSAIASMINRVVNRRSNNLIFARTR
jgi:hypothetical protein